MILLLIDIIRKLDDDNEYKITFQVGSKARKHVPQGGQVKIFNDKNYLKAVKVI